MKPVFRILPLTYFTLLGFFWIAENYMTTGTINYIAIVITALTMLQFFYKNKVLGIVTGLVLGVFSILMLGVQLDGLTDEYTTTSVRFLALAAGIFGLGVVMAVLLTVHSVRYKNLARTTHQ
jgi:H+/gluconate symporter-like permease